MVQFVSFKALDSYITKIFEWKYDQWGEFNTPEEFAADENICLSFVMFVVISKLSKFYQMRHFWNQLTNFRNPILHEFREVEVVPGGG